MTNKYNILLGIMAITSGIDTIGYNNSKETTYAESTKLSDKCFRPECNGIREKNKLYCCLSCKKQDEQRMKQLKNK